MDIDQLFSRAALNPNHPRICYVVSSEITVSAFLREQMRHAGTRYDVTLVVNTSNPGFLTALGLTAKLQPIAMVREIAPWRDARALLALYSLFRRERFDLVHSVSPKAGLLSMLAGFMARVPVRIHTFTGQVWVTRKGCARWFLKLMDRLIVLFATHVLVDSPSQREFLLAQRVVSAEKSLVLGKGSIAGVDASRFKPDLQGRAALRSQLGYRDDDVVMLYLGRLNRDKGVLDLAQAFARVVAATPSARLLVVGPDEGGTCAMMQAALGKAAERARFVSYTDRPQDYMAACDVFCLPSYREGFGTAIIEAAACGVPAIASRIYGITDAVVNEVTGILHPAGDIAALGAAMARLAQNAPRRRAMGEAARQRVLAEFPMPALTSALLGFYEKILN